MNALELRNLSKSFPGYCLGPLSLSLPQGSIMGLIGAPGAGKTTLVQLILDMLGRDSGTITILGSHHPQALPRINEEMGVVPEEPGLPPFLTPIQIEGILSGIFRSWNHHSYERLLSFLCIPTDKKFLLLSDDMKARLGLAIAMAHDPRLLVLDDTLSQMTPVMQEQVQKLLREFTQDGLHSVLLLSGSAAAVEPVCDTFAFLYHGTLLLTEKKEALNARYGLLRCSDQALDSIPARAVRFRKDTDCGVEAVVVRQEVPSEIPLCAVPVDLLYACMGQEV